MHRSWWVYPRHPLLRRTWRSSDNSMAAVVDMATTFLRGFITTATERAPTRGRPSAGSRGRSWQTRRLNSLNSLNTQRTGPKAKTDRQTDRRTRTLAS